MYKLFLLCVLAGRAYADDNDDVQVLQNFKSVKGGHGGGGPASWYNPGAYFANTHGNSSQYGGNNSQYGGYNSEYGGYNSQYGRNTSQFGGNASQYGGYNSQYGGNASQYGGYNSQYGGYNSQYGGNTSQQGGYNSQYGGYNSQYGGNTSQQGGYNSQYGGNNLEYGGYNMRHNLTNPALNLEAGVCYIEVPTATLVRDGVNIPAGNGSRPDLSRVRSCCRGYTRNIYNFYKCDPVCSKECVNALCTAPEVCTCFPDHVKNSGGFCVATCPIGCQNGRCEGRECVCNPGYTLDRERKFCVPLCREHCSGSGNCTAPDTCECRQGLQSTKDGACKPFCERCDNGKCVGPNNCQCNSGFQKTAQGCVPVCDRCINGDCVGPNLCRCHKGYTMHEGLCVEECRPGYQLTASGCKLVCGNCVNGDCAPEGCRCHQGYSKDERGQCVPYCAPGICGPNTRCIAPNVCSPTNQSNLYPSLSNQYPTQPSQYPNQPNQYPNQPNQYPNQPNQYPNQPTQYPNQPNQYPNQPTQPNQYYPYQPNTNNQLYPESHSQYPTPGGVSQCPQTCLNGVCVDNRCQCNPGYVTDRTDETGSRCVPHCPGGCANGSCSAPNFCVCNLGFVKDHSVKGRQSCVKRTRRSVDSQEPVNVAELLTFEIPVDY